MQRACRYPVEIWKDAPANGSQPVEVEVRIARFQRVKGPFNQPDSAAKRFFPLKELEHSTYSLIAILLEHAGHVRVQERRAISHAGDGQRVPRKLRTGKCAEDLTTGMRGDYKHRRRFNLQILLAPNLFL